MVCGGRRREVIWGIRIAKNEGNCMASHHSLICSKNTALTSVRVWLHRILLECLEYIVFKISSFSLLEVVARFFKIWAPNLPPCSLQASIDLENLMTNVVRYFNPFLIKFTVLGFVETWLEVAPYPIKEITHWKILRPEWPCNISNLESGWLRIRKWRKLVYNYLVFFTPWLVLPETLSHPNEYWNLCKKQNCIDNPRIWIMGYLGPYNALDPLTCKRHRSKNNELIFYSKSSNYLI